MLCLCGVQWKQHYCWLYGLMLSYLLSKSSDICTAAPAKSAQPPLAGLQRWLKLRCHTGGCQRRGCQTNMQKSDCFSEDTPLTPPLFILHGHCPPVAGNTAVFLQSYFWMLPPPELCAQYNSTVSATCRNLKFALNMPIDRLFTFTGKCSVMHLYSLMLLIHKKDFYWIICTGFNIACSFQYFLHISFFASSAVSSPSGC